MPYRIELLPSARREFAALPGAARRRVGSAIERLGAEPMPRGCRRLAGAEDLLRIRVVEYRVVYRVEVEAVTVLVLRVGHRREVYRRLAEAAEAAEAYGAEATAGTPAVPERTGSGAR